MPPKQRINQAWLITFTDLTALLLAFFVLLFSMSEVQQGAWEAVVQSLSIKLNSVKRGPTSKQASHLPVTEIFIPKAVDPSYFRSVLADKVRGVEVLERAVIQQLDDRMVISLPADALFERGSATLTEEAMNAAMVLSNALLVVGNRVDVIGHTDPDPVQSAAYPSNWELSLARATAMALALKDSGYPNQISAFGYADSRFEDLSFELSEERRYQLGRRVDIVVREGAGVRSDK
tara:strand:- start:307 stop:1008 length:702 start_codon:yes stop_codon:yes gene_type:complete